MAMTLSKSELKPKLLDYLRRVEYQHDSIVVTSHGKPIAKIIPYDDSSETLREELTGTVLYYDKPLDPIGEDDWELHL